MVTYKVIFARAVCNNLSLESGCAGVSWLGGLEGIFSPYKPLNGKGLWNCAVVYKQLRSKVFSCQNARRLSMREVFKKLWQQDEGQDIAEYAVMLAVILVIVVGTIRLIGSNANNVFSSVASSIQ